MRKTIGLWIAVALLTTGAHAQKADPIQPVVAEQDRHVPGGRAVQIALPQREIDTMIDAGRVAQSPFGGSLLGAFAMDSIRDDNRDTMQRALFDKAEALADPLRQTLRDVDVEALALATTRNALTKPDWFEARDVTATRDPSGGFASLLASSDAAQFALIQYRYALSPDFTQIRVSAEITLRTRPAAKDTRAAVPLYRQRILSIVQLRTRSYEAHENAARWRADNGKLARAALTAAFGQFEQLLPYTLGLRQADVAGLKAKNREKAYAGGFYGTLIARSAANPEDILIWSDGLVHVQPVP